MKRRPGSLGSTPPPLSKDLIPDAYHSHHLRFRCRRALHPPDRLIMYALKSQPGAIESSTPVAPHALTFLDDDAFKSLPSAEDSVALCTERIAEAIRLRDPKAIKSWIYRETHAATDRELRAVLDASCNAVATDIRDIKELNATLAFLKTLRAEVSDDLQAMRSSQRTDGMTSSNIKSIIAGLLSAIEAYDEDTAVHLRATAALAERIANTMQLDEKTVSNIRLAALLHDIGKIKVPIGVLNHPGMLSDSEWVLMKRHPQTGFEMLERHPELRHISQIVKSHHERMDGRGYPDRLAGEDIPFEARVVAVADAFHAMTVTRSYRAKMSPKAALDELYACRGTQFDPTVVDGICETFNYVPLETVTRALSQVRRGA